MPAVKKPFRYRLFWDPKSEELIDARDWRELHSLEKNAELMEVAGDSTFKVNYLKRYGMPQIVVVNLHYQLCDIRIDRGTPYGNRQPITELVNRETAVKWFSEELKEKHGKLMLIQLLSEVKSWEEMGRLVVRLGCWCKPALCHGDVLKSKLESGR